MSVSDITVKYNKIVQLNKKGKIMFKTKLGREITYYGRENTKEITKVSQDYPNINTIDDLFGYLLEIWCRETAYPSCQSEYSQSNDPTLGQCAITATLVHDIFGGTIHKIFLEGGGTHYFNKINDNYIDLTNDQFSLYGIPVNYEQNVEVPIEYCGKNANTMQRFNLLKDLLEKRINV